MNDRVILQTGIIGSVLVAICCFTPALVLLLGVLGLSAWIGWLDHVLLPALFVFLGLTLYGLHLRQKRLRECCDTKEKP